MAETDGDGDAPRGLPYGRHWIDDADIEAVVEVLRGDWLTTGPLVARFEQALAQRGGAAGSVAVSSGTAALHCTYAVLGLQAGDEVIVPALTFVATASCALALGARVRFADVGPGTGTLDPASVAELVTERTRAIVAVDYAGHPADYEGLRAVADRAGCFLLADAAHSLGASRGGAPVGSLADATTLSFHPVKTITTAEGGALLSDREDLLASAARFRNHGIERDPSRHFESGGPWHYEVHSLGLNYRLPDVMCALGLQQLARLDAFVARRRAIAARYGEAFSSLAGLELPVVEAGVEPGWHLYVVRVRQAARRRAFFEALQARGLGVQLHYEPIHLHPLYRDLGSRPGDAVQAEDYAARAVSLPIFPRMEDADVERVIDTVTAVAVELL